MVETTKSAVRDVSLNYRPISPYLGAVLEGIDGRVPLSSVEIEDVKALLMRYKVLFLPSQGLGLEEQERFAAQFGQPRTDPLEDTIEGHPGLSHVENVPFFHSDFMHQEDPPLWSMLQMLQVPELGGDTMFADLVTSYEALSEGMRAFLETLTVTQRMSPEAVAPILRRIGRDGDDAYEAHLGLLPRSQPLVRYIPETGRKNYWVSRSFTECINELTLDESDAILRLLFAHQIQPQYVIRWTWSPGDIAFWDHRTTLHRGIKDYGTFERLGLRATIQGGRLVPASSAAQSK